MHTRQQKWNVEKKHNETTEKTNQQPRYPRKTNMSSPQVVEEKKNLAEGKEDGGQTHLQ